MAKTGDPPGCGSGRSRRYEVPAEAARTIAALTVLRDQVIAPILAGVASPRQDQTPGTWTRIDHDYEPSAATCKPSSTTSASPPGRSLLHRQHFVDLGTASVYSSQGRSTPIMREFQGPARAVGALRQHRPPPFGGLSIAGCRRAVGVDFEVQRHMVWPESKEAR